jgi:hypothetical protein
MVVVTGEHHHCLQPFGLGHGSWWRDICTCGRVHGDASGATPEVHFLWGGTREIHYKKHIEPQLEQLRPWIQPKSPKAAGGCIEISLTLPLWLDILHRAKAEELKREKEPIGAKLGCKRWREFDRIRQSFKPDDPERPPGKTTWF